MDADETGLSSAADLFDEDDGAVISAAVHSHKSLEMLLRRRARAARAHRRRRYCCSVPGLRTNKRRDFAAGLLKNPARLHYVNA